MKKKLELIIRKILMKKYPEIIDINITDTSNPKYYIENHYKILFETSTRLSRNRVNEISEELTTLYRMLNPTQSSYTINFPTIDCTFQSDSVWYDISKISLF